MMIFENKDVNIYLFTWYKCRLGLIIFFAFLILPTSILRIIIMVQYVVFISYVVQVNTTGFTPDHTIS